MGITAVIRRFLPVLDKITVPVLGKPSNIIASFVGTLLAGIGGTIASFQISAKATSYLVDKNIQAVRNLNYSIFRLQDQLYRQDRFQTLEIENNVMKQAKQRKDNALQKTIHSPFGGNNHVQRETSILKLQKALGV